MVRHYQRLRHISTGRLGLALLVQDAESGKLAVMKAMDVSSLGSAERLELLRELQRLAQLRHPHLCGLSECFLHQGKLCQVMDYLPGGSLAAQVAAGHDLGNRILLWFTQALMAVEYLHRCEVLHRDLRLRRLLLTRQGLVVVTGVALSAVLKGRLSSQRRDMEAMKYLAPEILLQNEEHSASSDMWALGVILYELIALKPPWEHTDLARLRDAVKRPLRPLPARHSELAPLCYALLKRKPWMRWSASQLLRHEQTQSRLVQLLKMEHEESSSSCALPTTVQCWNSGVEKYPTMPLGDRKVSNIQAAKVQPSPRGLLPGRCAALPHTDMYKTF